MHTSVTTTRTKLASSRGTDIPVGTPGHSGRKLKPVVRHNQIRCSLASLRGKLAFLHE